LKKQKENKKGTVALKAATVPFQYPSSLTLILSSEKGQIS